MTAANDIVRSCRHQKATDKVGGSLLDIRIINSLAYTYARLKTKEHRARNFIKRLQSAISEPNDFESAFLDTIGYVKLRFYKDTKELKEALLFFEEAKHKAKKIIDDELSVQVKTRSDTRLIFPGVRRMLIVRQNQAV